MTWNHKRAAKTSWPSKKCDYCRIVQIQSHKRFLSRLQCWRVLIKTRRTPQKNPLSTLSASLASVCCEVLFPLQKWWSYRYWARRICWGFIHIYNTQLASFHFHSLLSDKFNYNLPVSHHYIYTGILGNICIHINHLIHFYFGDRRKLFWMKSTLASWKNDNALCCLERSVIH